MNGSRKLIEMEKPKKLIEVAMPIKEISAESVRDKSIRHGHISTLHLWWARRPLPVCRAVVFASLVPDPLDENCPKSFKDAVELLLGKQNNIGDPYKPYDDIPYTAANDTMDDNLRNRLLMFIGKFSERYILNEKQGKKTEAKDILSDSSLIKWENKNNDEIVNKARKLIWVSHNSPDGNDVTKLLDSFDSHYTEIKIAEEELFSTPDRHIESDIIRTKEKKLRCALTSFLSKMPVVFDPFAGGGGIPLEASRLGCRSYGNDLNPVAHIIEKACVEFPQKFGKPILYTKKKFEELYGREELVSWCKVNGKHADADDLIIDIPNRLTFDVEYYAKKLLVACENEIGHLYPTDDKGIKPVAYYWARVGICNNPSCRAEVPLLRDFYLANRNSKKIFLRPVIKLNTVDFEIDKGAHNFEGWMSRANLKCPCCGNITDVKELKKQFVAKKTKEKLLAVIYEINGQKKYRLPNSNEVNSLQNIPNVSSPDDLMPENDSQNIKIPLWGFKKWSDMFLPRQKVLIDTLINKQKEIFQRFREDLNTDDYFKCVFTYITILIDRTILDSTSFGRWHTKMEKNEHPYGRQAIPMVFDFPEVNIFANGTSNMLNRLGYILNVINSESSTPFIGNVINSASGDISQFSDKYLNITVTDPPYYDSIAYADLSDFFYIWLKRMIGNLYPFCFSIPQTPKSEECTAIKHRFNGDTNKANEHFEKKLMQIIDVIERQTSDLVSIMFAHQSTKAWTTLCNSILGARMNITGSWAIDTEMAERMLAKGNAALSSSVTISCRPSLRKGFGGYKEIRKAIELKVETEVNNLYQLGFRGADLLTACFGQAVSVFGRYERVEKADGSEVSVTELLELAKESAFNALLKGFNGDEFTKFYIGWLQLFGFTESDFDDAAKFARVGLNINVSELFTHNLFIKNGNKQVLAGYKERLELNHKIGEDGHNFIIDFVHKAMFLYVGTNRNALLAYIAKVAASPDNSFWRVITSLCEILPQGSDDYKQASGLLLNKDSLIRESKNLQQSTGAQGQLF